MDDSSGQSPTPVAPSLLFDFLLSFLFFLFLYPMFPLLFIDEQPLLSQFVHMRLPHHKPLGLTFPLPVLTSIVQGKTWNSTQRYHKLTSGMTIGGLFPENWSEHDPCIHHLGESHKGWKLQAQADRARLVRSSSWRKQGQKKQVKQTLRHVTHVKNSKEGNSGTAHVMSSVYSLASHVTTLKIIGSKSGM